MAEARYRIRTVSEMTGINAATLRAWERRYGVPEPKRTESAYRLYSDDDVALIRRLKELVDSGMAPAQAAQAALEVHRHRADAQLEEDVFGRHVDRLVETTRAFDLGALREALTRTLALGSARTIFERVLAPALVEVGELWHAGEISVAHEHMASELIGSTARQLLTWVQPDEPFRRAVLAPFEGEQHAIALYGVALTLAEWGYQTVILGSSIPAAGLAVAVGAVRPNLVGLTLTVAPRSGLSRTLASYADALRGVEWIVGGQAAEAIRSQVESAGGVVGDLLQLRDRLAALASGR